MRRELGTPVAAFWVGLAVTIISMAAHIRVPLLPDIGVELKMTPTLLGLLTTSFGVGRLVVDIPAGAMMDRLGPRFMFALSGTLLATGGLLFAEAVGSRWVLTASCLLGAASAIANTTGMTFFSARSTNARRGRSLAMFSAALLGGQALGPIIAGGVAALGTWRTAMLAVLLVGLAVSLVGIVGGCSAQKAAASATADSREIRSRAGNEEADAAALCFSGVQRACLYSIAFTSMLVIAAVPQTLVPIIGSRSFGFSADVIGIALGVGGVCRIVGVFVGGPLSDRYGRKLVLVPGLALQALGVGFLAFEGSRIAWLIAIVVLALMSFSMGTGAAVVGDRVERSRVGRALGRYRFAGDIGLIAGPTITAALFEWLGQPFAVATVALLVLSTAAGTAVLLPETHKPTVR